MTLPLVVGPLYMLITVAIVAVLFWKKSMSKRSAMIVLAGSVVVAGFLQWGFLDTTIYLHQLLYGIVNGGINSTQAFKVVLILASSLVLGRLFCGYICPLGAAQELVSKLVKKQAHIDVKLSEAIRAVFFVAFIVIGIGIASIVHFNPFSSGLALAWHLQAPGAHHRCRRLYIRVPTLVYSDVPLRLPHESDIQVQHLQAQVEQELHRLRCLHEKMSHGSGS